MARDPEAAFELRQLEGCDEKSKGNCLFYQPLVLSLQNHSENLLAFNIDTFKGLTLLGRKQGRGGIAKTSRSRTSRRLQLICESPLLHKKPVNEADLTAMAWSQLGPLAKFKASHGIAKTAGISSASTLQLAGSGIIAFSR